jgi:hypothetical protein
MSSPYNTLPARSFWARAVQRPSDASYDPVVGAKTKIGTHTKVATAGSCFAQHISRYLGKCGVPPYVVERSHPMVVSVAEQFHYGVYSARYGNIYTAAQLRQLRERAFGLFKPREGVWRDKSGVFIDPFRPALPGGFVSEAELVHERGQHLMRVRHMFETLDVMVFTLGLTESWVSREDGAVFPSCPGAIAGEFDDSRHMFVNYSVADVVSDLSSFITAMRDVNPKARYIFTVSPVPLVATATGGHVVQATTYSKSVLRVAAQQIIEQFEEAEYFPSYEIITGPRAAGRYFESDLRNVKEEGVAYVMERFIRHYLDGQPMASEVAAATEEELQAASMVRENAQMLNVICEEIANDPELRR